ncbi:eae-like domain protein [Atlantibacter hermannii]|uniref:eae-like domain protein n=1 Tax=Atlantibacter hermannii TaxID=565 RepID=UPI003A5C7D63
MTTKSKQLVRAGHELASELKADCGAVDMRSVANLLTELASALDVQSARSDALAAELARYSMPAGEADQRMAESRAVRQALGFGQDADDVAPVDLVERINALAAELKQSKIDAECYKHGMEQSNKRLTEIAAENAALKAICEDRRTFIMNGVQFGYIQVPTVETDPALETIRIAVSPQEPTPATDAWVNEQRAVGVDDAINVILTMMERFAPAHHAISMLRAHAAQLRGSQV